MKILVANLGSTSFKYRLFDMADERQLARGGVERIGSAESPCFVEIGGQRRESKAAIPDHAAAVRECLARQFFRSSSGRSDDSVSNAEQSFVNMWKQMSSDQQGKFVEVLVAYVRSPLFDQRSVP